MEPLHNYSINVTKNGALYCIDSNTLALLNVKSWKRNRPADEERVKEILANIQDTQRIQGIIYLAHLNSKLVCYDGNHRRLALKRYDYNMSNVLIHIIWNAPEQTIVKEFNLLNKAVSVPQIYLRNDSSDVVIVDFVRSMVEQYPSFCSSSKICKTPNFNRDLLTDDITDIVEEYSMYTAEQIVQILSKMNDAYKKELYKFRKTSVPETTKAKCAKEGLWLFWQSRRIDRIYLARVVKVNLS